MRTELPDTGHNGPYAHDLFDEQASRRPSSAAVDDAGTQLTYRQLRRTANQLAHYLLAAGVGPETLVGVGLERGRDVIRCLLAVLKAGGAYLPLDPALPAARLAQLCSEASPGVILVSRADAKAFAETGARLLVVEDLTPKLADQPTEAPEVRLQPDSAAYVICTSGSTGQPKAVVVSHGSLACVSQQLARQYRIGAQDRVLQLASLGFDTSIEQVLVALLSGATLMLPGPGTLAPADLLDYLAAEQVTVIDLVPAYWHQLLAITEPRDQRLQSVRLMITGGDTANGTDCRTAMRTAPQARLINAYGLTETTITSTLFDVGSPEADADSDADMDLVPVGQPLPHTQVLVLDPNLKTVPPGETGEIYIGGCGVARGYLGRPGPTAGLFLPDPAAPGRRMYRTGDRGRWNSAGNLEVIGRVDGQVKIRGFRVEPAEIEHILAGHPDIEQATVVARDLGFGHRQLQAYYTRRPASAPDLGVSLRSFLAARVPGYMIPAVFTATDQLPPAPRSPSGAFTPVQAGMSHLWSTVLKTGTVSLDDDFFELGGDSLLAAELLARVRVTFGISATYIRPLTRSLLRDPTLRSFASATADARAGRLAADDAEPRVDFTREAELEHPIRRDAGIAPDWKRPREILLTGATGFFGIHLLRELLGETTARVHCLVRAGSATEARQRIADAARHYELDLALDRVVPVAGDLAAPNLGLPTSQFDELARTIDIIHHAGAQVNFIYSYAELRAANVTGTRELIRLAGLYRGIGIHYISTMTVLAGFGVMGVRAVTESTPLAHADHLCMGYIETKFVSEELLRNAGRAGLPVAIYRPLDITGDRRTGAWNTATEMCALIRFITDTHLAPDIDLPLDFVPVDICASTVQYISAHTEAAGLTYHIASPRYALLSFLVDRLRHHGFVIDEIPYDEWVNELLQTAARIPEHPMNPFVPLFIDHCDESGLTVAQMYLEHIFPSYTRLHTEQALLGSGITLPAVDSELVDLNIVRLIATGYLRAPDGTRRRQD